jgi:DNA replication protein DnaC
MIQRGRLESLHELGFIKRRKNVIFRGPLSVGKTV